MSYIVELGSDEFGIEEFNYSTKREARRGAQRLRKHAEEHRCQDGIERYVSEPRKV